MASSQLAESHRPTTKADPAFVAATCYQLVVLLVAARNAVGSSPVFSQWHAPRRASLAQGIPQGGMVRKVGGGPPEGGRRAKADAESRETHTLRCLLRNAPRRASLAQGKTSFGTLGAEGGIRTHTPFGTA